MIVFLDGMDRYPDECIHLHRASARRRASVGLPAACRARRDPKEENPLRCARGFDLAREAADASQLTDEDIGLANVILTHGARA
ncbi:hypothetical protein [Streptomyces sp. IBSBF 3136]|uniref:hypothetical protein n=1 Tax=Streptomyces sp. IBSBF 3136 TaxID=2903524 RepID=UPI002FDBCEAB